ncbi:MAG: GerMN domain-containing protein [Oscillospiraceae bacterium]|nr:GerMN domain-containing protein [Oscillospiraceae bacterium]
MKRTAWIVLSVVLLAALALILTSTHKAAGDTLSLYYPISAENRDGGGDALGTVHVDWRDERELSMQEQAEEVVRLLTGGCRDKNFRMPVPNGTKMQRCTVAGSMVTVDFNGVYGNLGGMDLTIADYCIALSILQIPGVYTVRITVNERDLAYRGQNVFHADDVLLTSQEDVVRNLAVRLYFPQGNTLVAEDRILTVYEGDSPTGTMLEALAAGPEGSGLQPLLSKEFKALSTWVENSICYVNLPLQSEQLLPQEETAQRLTVEGIVRSLCTIRGVTRVQFLVEGERVETYGGVDVSMPITEVS